MLDISDTTKKHIIDSLIGSNLEIVFVDGDEETITEINIASESMNITQTICDDSTLKFGGCIASKFTIDLINSADRSFSKKLVGKWISVRLIQRFPSDNLFTPYANQFPSTTIYPNNYTTESKVWYLFSGYIFSAERDQNDKNTRHIVAYDAFAKLYELDGTNMLFAYWTQTEKGVNLGDLIVLCLNHNGSLVIVLDDNSNIMDEVINAAKNLTVRNLITHNDDWIKNSSSISYGEILRNVCELIGCFGVIKPNAGKGVFNLISLGNDIERYDFYENLNNDEDVINGYTKMRITISGDEREAKTIDLEPSSSPDEADEKIYDLSENILVWQKSGGAGTTYDNVPFNNLYNGASGSRMYNCAFTALTATLDGRPWVEVGDKINIITRQTDTEGSYIYDESDKIATEIIESYVMSRTLSGIHALKDTIEAKGE